MLKNIDEVRDFFKNDRFATETTGIEVLVAKPGYAKCSFKIHPEHLNGLGSVMGGAIFTLADFTFAVASNQEDVPVVTASSNISYLGKAKGDTLIAESRLIKDGRSICVYEIMVSDNLGNAVAVVMANGMKVKE